MESLFLDGYRIDNIEIYTPAAKLLAFWHVHALGFELAAKKEPKSGREGICSYLLTSGDIRLVLTSSYPVRGSLVANEIASFILGNSSGVKRVVLAVSSVKDTFNRCIAKGAIPIRFPGIEEDDDGYVEEAAIKLFDNSELVFINRDNFKGSFRPGYTASGANFSREAALLSSVDHIAGEVRMNECDYWTKYLSASIGTQLVQQIGRSSENQSGMLLNINQSGDKNLTIVIAQPASNQGSSKVQQNIDAFGPGIHHLAFSACDIHAAIASFRERGVDFVGVPASYYQLLRQNDAFRNFDIDALEAAGILIDKEGDSYLLQKFIKPMSDRPFFLYEIVQRINGYSGFALGNINVLKKAEEIEIMKANT
jgi:4-hydroxyphenylpyruvate dioxygenase